MTTTTLQRIEISIPVGGVYLPGILTIPDPAKGLIIFSHGSGSSRFSPRNNAVAEVLQTRGFATLLFDLLTAREDENYRMRFDIPLLTRRLVKVANWMSAYPETHDLAIGFFGASTGAASALMAAAEMKDQIKAVVSRGGRPDLAMDALEEVRTPTLLLIGGEDRPVIELNKAAFNRLTGIKNLKIIEGASHLFSEAGKLEEVAALATLWFQQYVAPQTHTDEHDLIEK